jgi:hypothetical protein
MINPNRKTELKGIDYVRGVAHSMECSFQEFSHHNDQGNDCYIEFVQNLIPSNYGVFVQIKSGPSFKDSKGYKIPADKSHLSYWKKNLYITIGIVYDEELSKAFWVDISNYIKNNPNILDQESHNIRVSVEDEFTTGTFVSFMNYCFGYKEELQSYENLGRSLELFSETDNAETCFEGFKALYSTHRNKRVAWFYIISNFSRINEEKIRRHIIGILSNYFNPDIFWHKHNIKNYPSENDRATISEMLGKCFGSLEVKQLLPYMKEGISRGSFSYLCFLILSSIQNAHLLLKEICFSAEIDDTDRNFYFWLYMHLAKYESIEETILIAEKYLSTFPEVSNDDAILGVFESIKEGNIFPVG